MLLLLLRIFLEQVLQRGHWKINPFRRISIPREATLWLVVLECVTILAEAGFNTVPDGDGTNSNSASNLSTGKSRKQTFHSVEWVHFGKVELILNCEDKSCREKWESKEEQTLYAFVRCAVINGSLWSRDAWFCSARACNLNYLVFHVSEMKHFGRAHWSHV